MRIIDAIRGLWFDGKAQSSSTSGGDGGRHRSYHPWKYLQDKRRREEEAIAVLMLELLADEP